MSTIWPPLTTPNLLPAFYATIIDNFLLFKPNMNYVIDNEMDRTGLSSAKDLKAITSKLQANYA